ncbi:gluconate 5-dehydrogenase [Usnea florida]
MSRLLGKVALITGSSSGIGRAIALGFAAQGTRLIICADVQPFARIEAPSEATNPTHELIVERYGEGRALFKKADMTIAGDVEACVAEAAEKGGRLDIIVNNVGGGIAGVRLHEISEEAWDASMNLNLRSAFLGSKFACMQFLTQQQDSSGQRGCIINLASIGGLAGLRASSAYSAAKAAVVNLTRVTAMDYGADAIRCNALCPGVVNTALTKAWFENEESARSIAAGTYLKKDDNIGDVAKAAVFLASGEDAGWITGVPLPVDGGWLAG